MKKIILIFFLIAGFLNSYKVSGQSYEIQQLLLNVEKLAQFRQILSDMKKGYQILVKGYNSVRNIAEGNFDLHKAFLDGLMEVSPTVRNYRRVAEIINCQVKLVKEYRNAYNRFIRDNNFNSVEINYIAQVYNNLFKESLVGLDELLTIITAGKTRMSDDERLQAIDRIYGDMQNRLIFLRHFNNNTTILALQRAKERNDAETIRKIYGLNP